MTRALYALSVAWALAFPLPSQAFTVATGFTGGCHEEVTAGAFQESILGMLLPGFTPPEDDLWRDLAGFMSRGFDFGEREVSDVDRYVLVSLIIGVRAPDTDGHSVTNLENLRRLRADPSDEGQYAHALRGINDDGPEGDVKAVEGTRQAIRDAFAEMARSAAQPVDQQTLKAPVYFDFYGRFHVEVWGPAYHFGRAAHALQDSFAHTLRAEDYELQKIATVFNYADAITSGFDRKRDGLPHSDSMDDCLQSTALAEAARRATVDLFLAARELASGRDPNALEHVLDRWVTLAPECTAANEYCGSEHWVKLAAKQETGPYLSCAATPGAPSTGASLAVLLALTVRSRRRR